MLILKQKGDWKPFANQMLLVEECIELTEHNKAMHSDSVVAAYALVRLVHIDRGRNNGTQLTGYITHKVDFQNIKSAMARKSQIDDGVVTIIWRDDFTRVYAKILSIFMPSLVVLLFKAEGFRLLTEPNYKPELGGEARFRAESPIGNWTPDAFA